MSTTSIQGIFGFTLEYVLPWEDITTLNVCQVFLKN
jgi:hypothetical protein